jgi:hypothetical protein
VQDKNVPPKPSDETPIGTAIMSGLKAANLVVLGWAASLSWTRLFFLALVVAIASSVIANRFDLEHRVEMVKVDGEFEEVEEDVEEEADSQDSEEAAQSDDFENCGDKQITIGNNKVQIACERKATLDKAASASSPSASSPSASAASSPEPAGVSIGEDGIKIKIRQSKTHKTKIKKQVPKMERQIRPTMGGFINDLFSALYIAFFAYLIAAKIIVRKTEESDAKVRVATSQAEHEALERQLVQARLKVLQAQVEPHFLFNTLAAVDYLIETDPARASIMQKQLITYLRGALPQMREDSSTLGREISLVRAYLELLKMRIEDRLDYVIDVPEALAQADFPPMVLQTLVENAIKHGIEPKPEGGKITIHAQARDGSLWLDVVDTGAGLPEGDVFGKTSNGGGLGLDNIRKRLALLYPNASRIDLRSEIPCGTSVRIMVPYLNRKAGSSSL